MAYIECARTPAHLHYKGLNVHKVGALQVTPALMLLMTLKTTEESLTVTMLSDSGSLVGRVIPWVVE